MATTPAPDPLILTVGVTIPQADGYSTDHVPAEDPPHATGAGMSSPWNLTTDTGGLPAGLLLAAGVIYGTPEAVSPAGVYQWRGGWNEDAATMDRHRLTLEVTEPAPEPVTAAPPVFDDAALTVTIPESVGAAYRVDGVETPAGTYTATAGGTVTVTAEPADAGYVLEGDTEWVHTYPAGPDPEPDPLDLLTPDPTASAVVNALGPRVVKHAGRLESPEHTEQARASVSVVLEYVRGYTRERGFTAGVPGRDLQAVIVASSARLFTNPEQVSAYTLGDFTERPAILAGWTLAEMAVLRRHRVTFR